MTPTIQQFQSGMLQYVSDPLHAGQFIPENDPRYAVVLSAISSMKEDSILRNNALAGFNLSMKNWQDQAQQADDYGHARPPLPNIPTVEVDTVVVTDNGSYVLQTSFEPVAQYPSPLLPPRAITAPPAPFVTSGVAPASAPSIDALNARLASLEELIAALVAKIGATK